MVNVEEGKLNLPFLLLPIPIPILWIKVKVRIKVQGREIELIHTNTLGKGKGKVDKLFARCSFNTIILEVSTYNISNAVKALEKWRQTLSDDKLDECLPSILPKLNEYLLEDEEEAHQESKKASKSNAEGRDSLRTYILNFLGRIGGRVHDIVGSSEKDIAKGLRWTSSKDVLKIELIFDQINAKYKLVDC